MAKRPSSSSEPAGPPSKLQKIEDDPLQTLIDELFIDIPLLIDVPAEDSPSYSIEVARPEPLILPPPPPPPPPPADETAMENNVEAPVGMHVRPRDLGTKIWPLTASRSKTVQIGIDLGLWQPYCMFHGIMADSKTTFLRLSWDEVFILLKDDVYHRILNNFQSTELPSPFYIGGINLSWYRKGNSITLSMEREGPKKTCICMAKETFENFGKIRSLLSSTYLHMLNLIQDVQPFSQKLINFCVHYFTVKGVCPYDIEQNYIILKEAVLNCPLQEDSAFEKYVYTLRRKIFLEELLAYHEYYIMYHVKQVMIKSK